jgi:uncharacterized protein (DUF362 family)
MTEVVITRDDRIEVAIIEALERVPLASLVRGRLVAVKPNDTWASQDDTTGITQPDTLRAVLRAVRAYEPRTLVVTGGAGAAQSDEVFRIGGLMDVVTDEGPSSSITTARRSCPWSSRTVRLRMSQVHRNPSWSIRACSSTTRSSL